MGLHAWPAGGSAQLRGPASILLLVWVGLAGLWTFTTVGRRRLLSVLPADQRHAVDLVYLHGCTISEAAAIIGCSPAALQKRLYRGKRRLVKQLGQLL